MHVAKKIQFIIAFMALSICLCIMSSTYSRYVSDASGNVDVTFAKWQILINNTDITNNSSSELSFVPIIEENVNVTNGVVAPSSKGYFDIIIDPSNVDMSFSYSILFENINASMPDLQLTGYSILPVGYIEGGELEVIGLTNNTLTKEMLIDKENKFVPITIRVYFEWYEGENENMNDESDTAVGVAAANEGTTFSIKATISLQQII